MGKTTNMTWRAYGPDAILIQFAERPDEDAFQRCRAILQALSENPIPALVEFVPSYTSILLEFDLSHGGRLEDFAEQSLALLQTHSAKTVSPGGLHRVPVQYHGPDLMRVADHNGLTEDEVIRLHSARIYRVHQLGFVPGFPYLGDLDPKLRTPRLASPRPKVPAGSVAIGGEHTGIYTVDSPGGWNIIGHTEFRPFDLQRGEEGAFALNVGDHVKFQPE